ncbi:C-type lectin-related protein 2 [Plakobranchus ocellatus]|uniref:C-type lectin-related protein 2 n=1 Tax=Plakobranchus ocellatus TaxID=259542 RepID=A0AAV3YUM9_9GAST|nr:C-type lectin-related protein 2 [Plakobranchus ocellatus]
MCRSNLAVFIVILKLMHDHMQGSNRNSADAMVINSSTFSQLPSNVVSNITYGLSTSGWTGVSSSLTCALKLMGNCPLSRGFLYQPVSEQCTLVQWLYQGSGGTPVPAGTVHAHSTEVFLNVQLNGFCNTGFEAVEYGRAGQFSCLVEIPSVMNYQNATAECNKLDGYLASVKTVDKFEVVKAIANNADMWVGLDDIVDEGNFVWQEDGSLATSAQITAVFGAYAPSPSYGVQDCAKYWDYSKTLDDDFCYHLAKGLCETQPLYAAC